MTTRHYNRCSGNAFFVSRCSVILVAAFMAGFSSFPASGAQITYTEDTTDFLNPERGFFGTSTASKNSVIRKYIYFNASSPATGVALLQQACDDVRKTKKKLIPRLYYGNINATAAEITPLVELFRQTFKDNYDVIAVVEAGLIGPWGEWRPTTGIPETDFVSKKAVLDKLLEVVPKERMVALRYNADKRAIYGTNVSLTSAEAFTQSNRSRTAAHSDCFLADENSAGTYQSLGARGGWGLGIEAEKSFLNSDNLYVSQHGETCEVGGGGYGNCERALADLPRMRWDMLNDEFNQVVLNTFKTQGCYNEISKRLGYRIALIDGTFDDDVTDGTLDATIRLKNVGYGKIFNPRKLEMVLRHITTGAESVLPLPQDPRFWSPGLNQTLTIKLPIPKSVPLGNYSLFLSLQDPAPKLYGIPEYAIRLANKNTWEPSKGYNSLNHTVKISSHDTSHVMAQNRATPEMSAGIRVFQRSSALRSVEILVNASLPARVRIDVYNLSGSLVNNLADQRFCSGEHHLAWNRLDRAGRVQPAGVYCITLRSDCGRVTRQVILSK